MDALYSRLISIRDYGIIVPLLYPRKEYRMENAKVENCLIDAVRIVCAAIRRRKERRGA
jgi:hypothetical protein